MITKNLISECKKVEKIYELANVNEVNYYKCITIRPEEAQRFIALGKKVYQREIESQGGKFISYFVKVWISDLAKIAE